MNETGNRRWAGEQGSRGGRRSQAKLWVAVGIATAVVATAWLAYSYRQSDAAASAAPAALPQVVVSKPLVRDLDSRLGFLGQFSAVEQVEQHPLVPVRTLRGHVDGERIAHRIGRRNDPAALHEERPAAMLKDPLTKDMRGIRKGFVGIAHIQENLRGEIG